MPKKKRGVEAADDRPLNLDVTQDEAAASPYESPTLTHLGHFRKLVQGGGGKSGTGGDPGDLFKPSGQG